ncbi:MAG: formylmethanofuran dehydrogenase subunit C [Planctomycetia bacterium]|nr:formylmethanofuran dehydrogenase subunit C [Planctomycetia bacterium]
MSQTIFTLKQRPDVPLEAEVLTPDVVASLSHGEVASLPLFMGKRQFRVDDFFEVNGSGTDNLVFHGDCGRVKWIGRAMSHGRITFSSHAGMHLGAYMKGGIIKVGGDASDWVGGEMSGGLIHIHGHAGGQTGAAYRGSMKGMKGGTILIEGSAGIELGMRMRRGLIAVRGPVRDFAGLQMKGGTILLMSGAEIRTGAWMVRGTIISLKPLKMMPTFSAGCVYNPNFLRLYTKSLAEHGFTTPVDAWHGVYRRYTGDTSVPGKGEILVWSGPAH